MEAEAHKYEVVSVDPSMRATFESRLDVGRTAFVEFAAQYLGMAQVDLPLAYKERHALSDLTARFYLRPLSETEMVLVILDVHVF